MILLTGVAVVNTDKTELVQANFTVILSNGIGVQVVDLQKSNVLQLDLMMPMDSNVNVHFKPIIPRKLYLRNRRA